MADSIFQNARSNLSSQLFGGAEIATRQLGEFATGGGRFDPDVLEAMRLRLFGQAQGQFTQGLSSLAMNEAQFGLQQDQLQLQRDMFEAEKQAGKTNIWDIVGGVSGLLPGVGSLFQGISALRGLGGGGGKSDISGLLTSLSRLDD